MVGVIHHVVIVRFPDRAVGHIIVVAVTDERAFYGVIQIIRMRIPRNIWSARIFTSIIGISSVRITKLPNGVDCLGVI